MEDKDTLLLLPFFKESCRQLLEYYSSTLITSTTNTAEETMRQLVQKTVSQLLILILLRVRAWLNCLCCSVPPSACCGAESSGSFSWKFSVIVLLLASSTSNFEMRYGPIRTRRALILLALDTDYWITSYWLLGKLSTKAFFSVHHRPSGDLVPRRTSFLKIKPWWLSMILQPESRNCPIKMSDPDAR